MDTNIFTQLNTQTYITQLNGHITYITQLNNT